MPLTPADNPTFSHSLPELTTNSVAHPDTWNPIHQALLDNDARLHQDLDALGQSVADQVANIDERLDGVESSSSVAVQRAVSLDWLYRNNAIAFELFTPGYTLIDTAPIPVIEGVAGDDSLDVEDTSGLRAGDYYVLSAPAGVDEEGEEVIAAELVQIASILSGQRVRLSASLSREWGAGATLARSSLDVEGASIARGEPGDIYLSRTINIGTDADGGAVVIRRSLNAAETRLFYRDAYQPTWRETRWSMRRTGGSIPAGMADYEYILPIRGDGWLRMDIEGEPVTVAHIVALGEPTGLGGFLNPAMAPNTPAISAPEDSATGIMERPTLALSGYSSPTGNAQRAVQFQLSTTSTFEAVLHDSGALPSALSYHLPGEVLQPDTTYYVRGRVQDVAGLWSDWSATSTFETAASFVYVVAPSVTAPAPGAQDTPEQPTLATSAFAVSGDEDVHAATQWQIRAATGTYTNPVWDSGTDSENLLTAIPPAGLLQDGEAAYYVRARHQGAEHGWSEWSDESRFTTKPAFATIIGIALLATGGGSGTWSRVDESGNQIMADEAYFSSHQIYGKIQDVTIDGQAMVRIPAFYVKAGTIPSGPNAGKRAWWISDQPAAGFELHPAFMRAGAPVDQFWVGKYQGTADGSTKLGSRAGVRPLVNIDFPAMQARAAARNTGGVSGFMLWDYYQLSAIQLLAMIEMGGANSQALIGRGHVDSSPSDVQVVDHATVAQATWRGIVGLWGNVYQMVDGLCTGGSSRYEIWDKDGNRSYINTGITIPASGWTVALSAAAGDLFDLGPLFVPATTDSSVGNGTTADRLYSSGANRVAYHGGPYGYGSNAGLFSLSVGSDASKSSPSIGGRLAKV
jgi:hypothetical protein